MATKVKSKTEKEIKEAKDEVVVFMTPVVNFGIWVKPDYFEMAGPVRIPVKGEYISFGHDGKFATSDKDIITFLRAHPWYGVSGRFYEVKEG